LVARAFQPAPETAGTQAATIMVFSASIQLAREPETFAYERVIAEFERWLSVGMNGKD
jgi:hypothetical protein